MKLAEAALQMSETQLEANVHTLAGVTGWLYYHTHDSRRSEPGFPDCVMVHPDLQGRAWLLFIELKTEKGRHTPAQTLWLAALARLELAVSMSPLCKGFILYAATWRPRHWRDGSIERLLTGRWRFDDD